MDSLSLLFESMPLSFLFHQFLYPETFVLLLKYAVLQGLALFYSFIFCSWQLHAYFYGFIVILDVFQMYDSYKLPFSSLWMFP